MALFKEPGGDLIQRLALLSARISRDMVHLENRTVELQRILARSNMSPDRLVLLSDGLLKNSQELTELHRIQQQIAKMLTTAL